MPSAADKRAARGIPQVRSTATRTPASSKRPDGRAGPAQEDPTCADSYVHRRAVGTVARHGHRRVGPARGRLPERFLRVRRRRQDDVVGADGARIRGRRDPCLRRWNPANGFTAQFDAFAADLGFGSGQELYEFVWWDQWAEMDKNEDLLVCMKDRPVTPGNPAYYFNGVDNTAN